MNYECPVCGHNNIDVAESLPKLACDNSEHVCDNCDSIILVGWAAEVEVRGIKVSNLDNDNQRGDRNGKY